MKFNFMDKKPIWFSLSGIFIIISIVALIFKGLNFGIEFKGGTLFDLKFKKSATAEDVRKVLKPLGLSGSIVQPISKTEMLIKSKSLSKELQKNLLDALRSKIGIKEIRYIQNVGPGWGAHITRAAVTALILSLGSLLIYISIRFEFKMAVSAILALFHDILITIGVYALVGKEVTPNTIAALLTILGYSLYDTIVVFHRILENSIRLGKRTYSMMVNDSINQVLVRSLNTTLTTLLPVIALLSFGGETLKDFAFALFVGITSGAYSSIFTASPILVVWKEREPKYKSLRKRVERGK
ncbi:MAG: protein translocase subunit SecF [Actinobacteria bacterium]|nr:protein translocase subunit SecF [Actinomycetota bacterium]